MRQLLMDFPALGELDAAAIFGNAGHESRGLTDDQEDNPTVKGSRGGFSWMQWTGPRRRQIEAFAKEKKLEPDGDKAAYLFLVHELRTTEGRALPAILRAKTLKGKVEAFEKAFLRAGVKHYPSRLLWAERALDAFRAGKNVPASDVKPPLPGTPPASNTLPAKGARDNEVVAQVQRRLRELGYHEVGNIDGDFGDGTENGIIIFQKDNALARTGTIDSGLLVALAKAKPRTIAAAREDAPPAEVREKVPEARDSWWSKVVAFWGMVGTGIVAAFNFIISNLNDAKAAVKPLTDVLGTVPLWAWAGLVGGVLLTIYLKSRSSEHTSRDAYQAGARR